MANTYASLHTHVVFGTKKLEPLITAAIRPALHEYIGGIIRGLDSVSLGVGGVDDHVHLLIGHGPAHCVSDLVRHVKRNSTLWLKSTHGIRAFAWQDGFGAFSVSYARLPVVQRYIANQERHHRKRPFVDEMRELLDHHQVAYDLRYIV